MRIMIIFICRTPIPRPPRVNGHEIDLHKFYSLVCSRGGWAKVNMTHALDVNVQRKRVVLFKFFLDKLSQ